MEQKSNDLPKINIQTLSKWFLRNKCTFTNCYLGLRKYFPFSTSVKPSASTKSTIITKAIETSEIGKPTSNGIVKDLKSTTTELVLESKERPLVKREIHLAPPKESRETQLQQVKEPSREPPKEDKKGQQVLQKTSSTITLRSVKIQPGPKAELKAVPSEQEVNGEKTKQLLAADWQAALSTKPDNLTSEELENHVGLKKSAAEIKIQRIPPQFECRPQSQEALEGEVVTFRCRGKNDSFLGCF